MFQNHLPPNSPVMRGSSMRASLLTALFVCCSALSFAQAPTSLQYTTTPIVAIANVTNVYLAPTVAGNILSYSITPGLPSGITLNTNTGVISGTAIVASAATPYTVTATGTATSPGTTTSTFTLTVTDSYFNNNYTNDSFGGTGVTIVNEVGDGTHPGDIVLYKNVTSIGGTQQVDAYITTVSVTPTSNAGSAFGIPPMVFDQNSVSGPGYTNNSPRFFSPQIVFATKPGSAVFNTQFILGNSYNTATNTGTNVTLQNVQLNSYDIDGDGDPESNQNNEIGGFSSYDLGSGTTITPTYDAATGLTRFHSNIDSNSQNVLADATRIRVTYNNLSNTTVSVGVDSLSIAYFFFDFGTGPAFATAVTTAAPSVDLNTNAGSPGVNNASTGCATQLSFSQSSQTNIASPAVLNELDITFSNTAASIPNGASEQLLVSGGTGYNTIPLNFTAGTNTVTVGGVTYLVTRTVSATTGSLVFTNNAGSTFTVAQGEALLDALRYNNTAASPTAGDRNFTINVRNSVAKSPDAIFTATLNCVGISGNIYHDANGLTDNTVNVNGTQFGAAGAYAVLTDLSGNVLSTVPIAAGGAYTFGRQAAGTYNIYVSNTATPPATVTAATFPTGYVTTGENLGAAAGNDLLADGKLKVTVGSVSVTNANFGVELPPATINTIYNNIPNPGGFNYYAVPTGGFSATDADGTVDSLIISAFPTGANYLKIGTTIYTNPSGGVCPPQSACTTWPGSVEILYSLANTISVDPTLDGTTTVTIPYKVVDNARVGSNNGVASTVTLNFIAPASPIGISGNVWNDANGNGVKDGSEPYTAAAISGQTLYAVLVQTTNTYSGQPTVLTSTPVTAAAIGYNFPDVPSGNGYEVRIYSLATAPASGVAVSTLTPALATNYTDVSTNNNGTIVLNNPGIINPVISLGTVTSTKTAANFGIEQPPVGANYTAAHQANPGGAGFANTVQVPLAAFTGTDAEDGTYTTGLTNKNVTIVPVANGDLYYNGTLIPAAGQTFTTFNPALLTIDPTGPTPTAAVAVVATFTYAVKDAAGQSSVPKTVTMPFDPVVTISGNVFDDANGDAVKAGTEPFTNAGGLNAVLTDNAGNVIQTVAVNASGAYAFTKAGASENYKIVLTTTSPLAGSVLTASSLPAPATGNWLNTGVNPGGSTPTPGNRTGILSIISPATGSLINQNFAIEQTPVADPKAFTAPNSAFMQTAGVTIGGQPSYAINGNSSSLSGSSQKSLSGTDGEDCATASSCNTGKTYTINTINSNTLLYYNYGAGNVAVPANTTITNFNPANLTIYGQKGQGYTAPTALGFTYSLVDNAAIPSAPVTYTIQTSNTALLVELKNFSGAVTGCTANFAWESVSEINSNYYDVEQSLDGNVFRTVKTLSSRNSLNGSTYNAAVSVPGTISYFRLKMTDLDGSYTYSATIMMTAKDCRNGAITIAPNPAHDVIKIEGLSGVNNTIIIYDGIGRVMSKTSSSSASEVINLGDYASGTYLVQVIGANGAMLNTTKIQKD